MLSFVLLLTAASATGPFDPNKAEQLSRQHCAAKWPSDFEMQDYCLKQQRQGMHDYALELSDAPKPLIGPLYNCAVKWTENGIPDFEMIAYCGKQQVEAYQRLNSGE